MFFYNLKPFYLIDESILVEFDVQTKGDMDWVGLFPLGWTSLESYVTFEWVSESLNLPWAANSESRCQALLFHPQYHARGVSDSMLYQFVYISRQIEVLGKSGPFKFRFNTLADTCGKQPLFYSGDLLDVVSLKKENMALQEKCEKAEERTRHPNFIHLSDLMESLQKRSSVQIVTEGEKIWIQMVDPNEKRVEVFRPVSNNNGVRAQLSPVLNFLKKCCVTTESQLANLANSFASYFQPQPPVRLAANPQDYPEEGDKNLPERITQLFERKRMPNAGSITWNKAENSLDLELKLNTDEDD